MEKETLKLINEKIRNLLEKGTVSSIEQATKLIETINNPLISEVKWGIGMEMYMKYDELEKERQKLIYVELPCLIHRILQISRLPQLEDNAILQYSIKSIKKITNAECEGALVKENYKS